MYTNKEINQDITAKKCALDVIYSLRENIAAGDDDIVSIFQRKQKGPLAQI